MKSEPGAAFEQPPIPEKLYRGFVVNPEDLSLEMLSKALVMGQKNEEDSTKSLDGNEAGVYMSTNPSMVESTNYGNRSLSSLAVPQYASPYGLEDSIPLPGCGVIVEIETQGLKVRKPQISEVLEGHYNNGFQGDEWIADEIPPNHYCLKKLTLSLGANDPNKTVIEVKGDDQDEIERAIAEIKVRAIEQRKKAESFREFLEGLNAEQRKNRFIVEKRWSKAQGVK